VAVTETNILQLLLIVDVSIKQKIPADRTEITQSYIVELRSIV